MKFINKHKKCLCGIISSAMILGLGTAVFADEAANPPASAGTEATASPDATASPTAAPESKNISLDVTATIYDTDDKNVYRVMFKADETLPQIKEFEFTAAFSSGTIKSTEFGDSFNSNGTTSKSITDDKSVKFSWKDGNPVSGSVILAGAYVETSSALNSSSITLDSFTAVGSNGTNLIITPTLKTEKGVNMPNLSKDEQEIFNTINSLPSIDDLTFYDNKDKGTLCDLKLRYAEPINSVLSDYDKLSKTSRDNIDTALSINGKSISDIRRLQSAVEAMQEVLGIIELKGCYYGLADNSTALNYQYLSETFKNMSSSAPSTLNEAPTAANEYNDAVSEINAYNKIIDKQVALITDKTYENYQLRISALKTQFDSAKSNSQITLAKALLSSISMLADNLYSDIETNYTGSYKEYMLNDIRQISDNISSGDIIYKNMPEVEISGSITVGYSWTVTVSRSKALQSQDAKIEVYVYKENGSLIKSETEDFPEDSKNRTVSVSIRSTESKGNENINVKCYYVYNNISYLLDSKTVYLRPGRSYNTGGSTGGSTGGNTGNTGNIGGGNLYPVIDDNNTPQSTKAPSMANDNPYTDIDNYDWAHDAIIGLTNAGIVNGMGDNEFNPAGNVTREQFCKMVVQLFGVSASEAETDFVDVNKNAWYAPYISAAVQAGYVQGQSDEYFGIGEVIMRQDMATILYRASGLSGDGTVLDFTDTNNIASYAADAVSELVGLGVMNGYSDGSFKPRGSATRAEAAKVIWGIYEIIK